MRSTLTWSVSESKGVSKEFGSCAGYHRRCRPLELRDGTVLTMKLYEILLKTSGLGEIDQVTKPSQHETVID